MHRNVVKQGVVVVVVSSLLSTVEQQNMAPDSFYQFGWQVRP